MLSIIVTALIALAMAIPAPKFLGPAPVNFIDKTEKADSSVAKRALGGVRLSDGKNFTGHVWYGVYALNDCIALNDYAHNLLSFRPDEGTECMVFQDSCNGNTDYVTINSNSTSAGDLSVYDWIGGADSYMCMTVIWPKKKA